MGGGADAEAPVGLGVESDGRTGRHVAGTASPERRRALDAMRAVVAGTRADQAFREVARGLDRRQRHFLMELVYGSVRWRARLDYHLDSLLERGVRSLPTDVAAVLRLGAYQLLFMDRVPEHAAVHESVELARSLGSGKRKDWIPGLVNGVLRNLGRNRDQLPLPDPSDTLTYLSIAHSHPRWLVARWLHRWGAEATERVLEHDNGVPPLHLGVNPRRSTPESVLEALRGAGVEAKPHPAKPDAIVVGPGWGPEDLPGWEDGDFWVQDVGAQWVVSLSLPPDGETLLDACSAPGTKLCGLLARSAGVRALALDASEQRLPSIRDNCSRLKLPAPWLVVGDASAPPTGASFPFVLADVPCSGTGVLRRRVDARWRRRPGDLDKFAAIQRDILTGLADRVDPGGVLVYTTCSLEPEENEDVVRAFLEARPDYHLSPVGGSVPSALVDGPFLRTRPGEMEMDGMFAARIVRQAA